MAQEVIINVKTTGGEESLKNINDLKSAISKLEEESNNMDLGSEAFEDAKNNIDELKKKLEGLSKSQKKIDEEMGKAAEEAHSKRAERMEKVGNNLAKFAAGLADAFAGAFIAMGAGEEDAKKMNETLQMGVGIAIGAKGAIEALVAGVELATPAWEALNAVIAANPIGAVVVAVALLAAGIYLLIQSQDSAEEQQMKLNKAIEEQNELLIKAAKLFKESATRNDEALSKNRELREAQGASAKELYDLDKVILNDKIRDNEYYLNKVKDTNSKEYLDALDKKKLLDIESKIIDAKYDKGVTDGLKKLYDDKKKISDEAAKKAKEDADKLKVAESVRFNTSIREDGEYNDIIIDNSDKALEAKLANDAHMLEESARMAQWHIDLEKDTADKNKKVREDELDEIGKEVMKYTQLISSALTSVVGVFSAISDLRRQEEEQDTKERQEKLDSDLTSLNDAKDAELAKTDLTEQQKVDINNKYAQIEYDMKLDEYNRNTEIKKKAFEQDKKLKIASTIITTLSGAVSAFIGAASSLAWSPLGIALGVITAASVTAMGAINIAAISKQKFDAGSAPQAPKMQVAGAGGTGAGGGGGAQAGPSLYGVGGGDINTGVGGSSQKRGVNGSMGPQKVYVVSQEVTSSQNMDAVIERRSSF